MAVYTMFAACRCGEQIFKAGDRYSIYYIVRDWQKRHESLEHELISSEEAPEEYHALYSAALKGETPEGSGEALRRL